MDHCRVCVTEGACARAGECVNAFLDEQFPQPPPPSDASALNKQIGGVHYKDKGIQPVEYAHANKLSFFEGSVVKYVTRWRDKGGIADLEKAKHFIEILIELEKKNG